MKHCWIYTYVENCLVSFWYWQYIFVACRYSWVNQWWRALLRLIAYHLLIDIF